MTEAAPKLRATLFDRLAARGGVQPGQFRSLLYAMALMDCRNQQYAGVSRSKPTEVFTPIFWTMGQNLLTSGALCVVLFTRVDTYFFVLASLVASMLVMIASLIVEYDEAVLSSGDLEVIGHLPVPVRTYSAARLTNLLGYVLLVTVSMNVFPAIIALGHQDTTWLYVPAYVVAALAGNLLVAGLVVLVYTWALGGRPTENARQMLAWTQVALILLFVYGGQAVFRDSANRLEMAAYRLPDWVVWTPPGWLARFVESSSAGAALTAWWLATATGAAALAVWLAAVWRLSVAYARMQPGSSAWQRTTSPPLARPGKLSGTLMRLVTRPGDQRAGYWLTRTLLRRDAGVWTRIWPSLATVIAVACLGLATGQFGNPTTTRGAEAITPLACLYLLALPLPTILHNLQFSREHKAAWLLATSPVEDWPAFVDGLRRAVSYRVMLPLLLALGVAFAVCWHNLPLALLHVAVGWLVITAAGYASLAGLFKRPPFSSPPVLGESFGPIAPVAAAMMLAAMLAATIHYAVATSLPALGVYLLGLVVAVFAVQAWARHRIAQRFRAGGLP